MDLKANCIWKEGFKADIDNGRGHNVKIDLPEHQGGTNSAPTALELTVMSFAGCVVTIFALLAKKMQVDFKSLLCEVSAQKPDGAGTVTNCDIMVKINSEANDEKIKLCLDKTVKICPVGVIFERAGITVKANLERV
ncbi:MAG TPA: OsmC family protein [Elusimicrobiales bacterium]|nr:OsmC family protein [Elusimicrobiales bacterium]